MDQSILVLSVLTSSFLSSSPLQVAHNQEQPKGNNTPKALTAKWQKQPKTQVWLLVGTPHHTAPGIVLKKHTPVKRSPKA